jgi:hypothetical protein
VCNEASREQTERGQKQRIVAIKEKKRTERNNKHGSERI